MGRFRTVAALKERFAPVFQRFLDLVEELMGDGAVYHAMVIAQRHVAHGADGDGVVDDHRPLFDGAEAEDADVRLADDRQRSEEHTSELQSRQYLVCRLLLEKKKKKKNTPL